jgi:predicted AAA+ superfamily ATPase
VDNESHGASKKEISLRKLLEQVSDRTSFFVFVRALIADRREAVKNEQRSLSNPYGMGAGGWENVTIEDYLDAAVAWAEHTNMGTSQGLPEEACWYAFAVFLYCGKIYE